MLLLQWADRIGMTEPDDYDRRLDDPDLNHTIARVLESIKRLLSDGKALRDRYGLVDYRELRHEIAFDDRLGVTAGSTRLQKFVERFNRLSLHTGEPRRDHSVATRFKWVVKDKEKFANLMNELSYFVSRLNAIVPAKEHAARTMTEEDLAQIRSIPQLKLVVKASIGFQPRIVLVAQQAIRSLNQKRIVDRLWFRWIDDRETNISDRHCRTLEWAFETIGSTFKWDNLAEWLRIGSGLYWLDEFDGKHATIADFILKLGRLPNVKIIVSSRPLPVFVSRFEHAPKIYLQDLTTQDIETYINDTITHHPHMAQIAKVEPDMAMKIARLMIEKASGVFLWVVLACRSVLEGLDDHETVSELVSRTSELPPELGDFFHQIIAVVDPRKRDQCARLLRLVFESQKSSRVQPSLS